jgi:hypothetical protein|tara:strand:- start:11344 stop:11700 length:357 start_codon:yes stop_codon:yes gene_type:complete
MEFKYGLIKINDHKPLSDIKDDNCELVEIFIDELGIPKYFCRARINSVDELKSAYYDVMNSGLNTWLYENGTFSTLEGGGSWSWTKKVALSCSEKPLGDDILYAYEEEMELYKVYGGD